MPKLLDISQSPKSALEELVQLRKKLEKLADRMEHDAKYINVGILATEHDIKVKVIIAGYANELREALKK